MALRAHLKFVGDFNKRLVSKVMVSSSHSQLHKNKDMLWRELESPTLGFCQVSVAKGSKGTEDVHKKEM